MEEEEQRKHRLTPRLLLFFSPFPFWRLHWQKLSRTNCCMTCYGDDVQTEDLPMDILQQTKRSNQKQTCGNISTRDHELSPQFHCDHIVARFFNLSKTFSFFSFFWYVHCVVESSWLIVLRSEHDNLQTIRVVKKNTFMLRAGDRLFELLEQKKVNYCYIIYW